jgi:O-antigen ligase
MTTSRGGTGALAIGIVVAIAIAVSRKGVRARELRLGMMAVILALIAVFWLGPGQFAEKLQSSGLSSNRADQRELSYRIIEDSPLVGTGVGTFRWIFPIHKDERFGAYFYEHAHNDFLEVLSEQGIVGFSLLVMGVALALVHVVRAFLNRRDPLMRGALFATIAGCVSLMVHGLVDFNLQIPANASYFFVLLGVGVVASVLRHRITPLQAEMTHPERI